MAEERKQVCAWLPGPLFANIKELADADNRSISMWIRLLAEREVAAKKRVTA